MNYIHSLYIIFTIIFVVCCNAESPISYQLSYDGLIENNNNEIMAKTSSKDFVERITQVLAISIGNGTIDENVLDIVCVNKKMINVSSNSSSSTCTSTNSGGSDEGCDFVEFMPSGVKCIVDYRRSGFNIDATVDVHFNDDFNIIYIDAMIMKEEEDDEDDARDLLIQTIPILDKHIFSAESNGDVSHVSKWIIRKRGDVYKDTDRHNKVSIIKEENNSIDTRVLAKEDLEHKTLIYSSYNDKQYNKTLPRIDIWEYKSPQMKETYRDLFLDSKLRATTSDTGTAHAEAFVHPALIAHALPKRVALISDMPMAYVKEILKYKSVTTITLIGASKRTIDVANSFMPHLNDCTLILNTKESCTDDSRLEFINDDVFTWANKVVDKSNHIDIESECEMDYNEVKSCAPYPGYDVILIDIASVDQRIQWESVNMIDRLIEFTIHDSIVVFNSGSSPSIHDGGLYYSINENFISTLVEYYTKEDLWAAMMVYDEVRLLILWIILMFEIKLCTICTYLTCLIPNGPKPMSNPLDSAFFMIQGFYSKSYYRFVRETPHSIDLDMMKRMQSIQMPPTQFYDGTTHQRYLRPSRVWENWYCQSEIGKETLECSSLLKDLYDPINHGHKTEVRRDPVLGRSLHAGEDIPKGAFILGDDTHMHLHIDRNQWNELQKFIKDFPDAAMYKSLRDFFLTYGFENEPIGLSGWSVSIASNNTFTNHACTKDEQNVMGFPYTNDVELRERINRAFSIFNLRRPRLAMATRALRGIKSEETILIDYSDFRSEEDQKFTQFLQGICATGVGLVNPDDGNVIDQCIEDNSCI